MAQVDDHRTDEQREATTEYVNATDSFMSGWGKAKGGKSHFCIACETPEQAELAEHWLAEREEMKNVRRSTKPRCQYSVRDHVSIRPFTDTGAAD